MRILLMHIVDTPEQFGGAEKVFLTLAKEFAKDTFTEVAIALNSGHLFNEVKNSNIKTYLFPRKGILNIVLFYLSLIRTIRDFRPDIIHSHHRYTTFLSQLLPFRRYKLIHTFHLEQFTKTWNKFFGDYATAVSRGCKEHFIKYFNLNEKSVEVIYNGVYPDIAYDLRDSIGRKDNEIVFSLIGRLTEQKGHAVLLNAIKDMPEGVRENFKVFFIGEGEKRGELETMVKRLGLDEHVVFTGHKKNVYPYITASGFIVQPSLWEGFGLTIVESYHCGKPVIGSAVGGIPELIIDNETGALVPPNNPTALRDAILYFVNNPEVVKRLGEAGKKMALERFTVEKMIDNYKAFYRKIWGGVYAH